MSLRTIALLAVAVSALVWVAAVGPTSRGLRTAMVERQVAAHARLVDASGAGSGDPAKALRLFVVASVSRAPLSGVRLEASPGRGTTAARVRLSAAGSFHEILRLWERLVGPGSGLALERVQLSSDAASEGGRR